MTTGAAPAAPSVPEDLVDLILGHVIAQGHFQTQQNPHYYSGKSGLLSFALVSKLFYKKTLPFLYGDISFNISRSERFAKFQKLCKTVMANADLGARVESLNVVNNAPEIYELHIPAFNAFRSFTGLKMLQFEVGRHLQEASGRLSPSSNALDSSLRSYSFTSAGSTELDTGIEWDNDISLSVRKNLSVLFTLPSLTRLSISGIRNLPFTLLTSLTKIRSLSLGPNVDIDTSDETGLLSRTPMVTMEDVQLQSLKLLGVSSNLVRTLSSLLSCKPGVVRSLNLVSDVSDLVGTGELVGVGIDSDSDQEVLSNAVGISKGTTTEGLDEWVLDIDPTETAKPGRFMKKPLRLRLPAKKLRENASLITRHSAFSKAAWCLIEAAGTSLEHLEWESSPWMALSFKPINLHFLRHTLRFLTVAVPYHLFSSSKVTASPLVDAIEFCKQLSIPDTILEKLHIKCLATRSLESLYRTSPTNSNSSDTTLVGSDKTFVGSPAMQNTDYFKDWIILDGILKSKKSFKKLSELKIEFFVDSFAVGPPVEWWTNHARKVEKRLTTVRAKGIAVKSSLMYLSTC